MDRMYELVLLNEDITAGVYIHLCRRHKATHAFSRCVY
jgi:hypothetical protein